MSFAVRLKSRAWIFVLIAVSGFLLWVNTMRVSRVETVSGLAGAPVPTDASSPTGYAGGMRQFIVPEHNNDSYQWIAQTQQMFARGEWRIRRVEYDNAPVGRTTYSASVYRWWLGMVAWVDHALSQRPLGLSVERAALWADPLLHLLLVASAGIFAARHFGGFSAGCLIVVLATVFPFAGSFLPGQPADHGVSLICALWSVLPLLAGLGSNRAGWTQRDRRRQFIVAGIFGGLGLWVNVANQLPVLAGIGLGGMAAAYLARRDGGKDTERFEMPWRAWSRAGAVAVVVAFVIEYFPSHLGGWRLGTVHPLHAVAWIGLGELLARLAPRLQGRNEPWTRRGIIGLVVAALAVATVPVLIAVQGAEGIFSDPQALRLTQVSGSPVAVNLWAWISRDGFKAAGVATFVPLLIVLLAVWLLVRRKDAGAARSMLGLALGPVLVALVGACFQLRWWSLLDGMLIVLLLAIVGTMLTGQGRVVQRWLWGGSVTIVALLGLVMLRPVAGAASQNSVTQNEVVSLIERDLSQWLATRAGPGKAIVLAPPNLTTSVFFHGGSRGLGTPYRENIEGISAALRIASATSPDEAHALVRRREVTHIVMPSWDTGLDEYARLGANQSENSLVGLLHRWLAPRWLRPVPYQLPKISGFEGQSVVVFEVVEVQENAVALSNLAEYFVEMGMMDAAASVGRALEEYYPEDLNARMARARVASAWEAKSSFEQLVEELSANVSRGDDEYLEPQRRVMLALVLAEGKRFEVSKAQVERCFRELTEADWRALTTASLYRLLLLGKAFELSVPDVSLQALAVGLLPLELRAEIEPAFRPTK